MSDSQHEPGAERDGWKLLTRVTSRQVASLIEGLLESTGIPVEQESLIFTQEPVALGVLGTIKLWVPSERHEEAQRLLDEASLEEGETGESGEPDGPAEA